MGMEIIELSLADKESYNQFVASASSGSFLQSWEWGQWQSALGREVKRFKVLGLRGEDMATIQLIKMPLPLGKYYWYSPYGPVLSGQWAVDSGQIPAELQRNFSDAIFIRIEPKGKSLILNPLSLTKTINIQPGKTLLIDLLKSEEQLLAEMHPKTRYNIKVAQKHGVKIVDEFAVTIGHGLFFEEALKLILETSKRQGFTTFSAGYYKKLVDFFVFQNQASAIAEANDSGQSAEALAKADALHGTGEIKLHIYKAVFENKLLAAAIMLDFGSTRTFLFGGSSDENRNVMAPYLMHWQAMLDAKAAGYKTYDFWGTETSSGQVPGFVRFKLGFGGKEIQYAGAYDLVKDRLWYFIYRLSRKINLLIKKSFA